MTINGISTVDLNAQFYREHSGLQYGLSHQVLKGHTFNPQARILDVGCGDGRITADIARWLVPQGSVTGIDASPSMVALAKRVFPQSTVPNLEFRQIRVEEAAFSPGFDAIVSFSCLHWITQPQRSLRNLCSMLNPRGEVVILTYPRESVFYKFMDEALEEYPEYRDRSIYGTMLSIEGYRTALEGQIDISSFETKELLASYKTEAEIKDFIRGWLTSFVQLPEHLHDEFLDLVVQKSRFYARNTGNGMINLPYTSLTIKGIKKP